MKRKIRNVSLKLDESHFQMLKEYKDFGGLSNLSEAVAMLVEYSATPSQPVTPEQEQAGQDYLQVSNQHPIPSPRKVMLEDSPLKIEKDQPLPTSNSYKRRSFYVAACETVQKMLVGDSVIVNGENQRAQILNAARVNNIKMTTRLFDKKKDLIRAWRVA